MQFVFHKITCLSSPPFPHMLLTCGIIFFSQTCGQWIQRSQESCFCVACNSTCAVGGGCEVRSEDNCMTATSCTGWRGPEAAVPSEPPVALVPLPLPLGSLEGSRCFWSTSSVRASLPVASSIATSPAALLVCVT